MTDEEMNGAADNQKADLDRSSVPHSQNSKTERARENPKSRLLRTSEVSRDLRLLLLLLKADVERERERGLKMVEEEERKESSESERALRDDGDECFLLLFCLKQNGLTFDLCRPLELLKGAAFKRIDSNTNTFLERNYIQTPRGAHRGSRTGPMAGLHRRPPT